MFCLLSASFPYLRNKLYNVSCDNSAASPPGLVGTNSTFMRQLGNRYKSSSHGFPTTRFVLIRRNGLNHGFIGFSFKYRETSPSISFEVIPSGCWNLTKAPPSFNLGSISVTFIGTLFGIAFFTNVIGSHEPSVWLLNRLSKSGRFRSTCHGRRRAQLSFKGKISMAKTVNLGIQSMQWQFDSAKVLETYYRRTRWPHFLPSKYDPSDPPLSLYSLFLYPSILSPFS